MEGGRVSSMDGRELLVGGKSKVTAERREDLGSLGEGSWGRRRTMERRAGDICVRMGARWEGGTN